MNKNSLNKFVFVLIILAASFMQAYAGEFASLVPGVSKKTEADHALGSPIKEVEKGIRYDYDPDKYDAKRISLVFDKQSRVIQSIDLYFKDDYSKKKLAAWLGLGQPTLAHLENGHWVEYYDGIALYFKGKDDTSAVEFFSHLAGGPGAFYGKSVSLTDDEIVFLGVVVSEFDHKSEGIKIINVNPGSPAAAAGLKVDDIILEMGPHKFTAANTPVQDFVELVRILPTDQPTRFLIKRQSSTFSVNIVLRKTSNAEMKAFVDNELPQRAQEYYSQGLESMHRNALDQAIQDFSKAVTFNPKEAVYYKALADVYYRQGDLDKAKENYIKALKVKPQYEFYLAASKIYKEQSDIDSAIACLKEGLALKPKDLNDTEGEQLLGVLLFNQGNIEEAKEVFAAVYNKSKESKRNPIVVFYTASCFDRLGDQKDAVVYYRKYLALRHNDAEMNNAATLRLKALSGTVQPAPPASESLGKIVDLFQSTFGHQE